MSRRKLIARGLTIGGATAATMGVGAGITTASSREGTSLTVDVATLGYTWRAFTFVPLDPRDLPRGAFRGYPYYVEGLIYPGATLPEGEGVDVAPFEPIGHVFAWGYQIEDFGRTEAGFGSADPGLITTHQYLLGRITLDTPFPADQLVSSGLEFAHAEEGGLLFPKGERHQVLRAVTGGAGAYAGATGSVSQHYLGTNTTGPQIIGAPPEGDIVFGHTARNYRLQFALWLPPALH